MTTPTTEKQKSITLIVDCYCNDEYAEHPSFVAIEINKDFLNKLGVARAGFIAMKSNGFDAFKVSSFDHTGMFLDPVDEQPLKEVEQKSLRFLSKTDKEEWESRFLKEVEEGDEHSQLDCLEGDHAIETDMINITEYGFSITGYIKYIGSLVESPTINNEDIKKIISFLDEV